MKVTPNSNKTHIINKNSTKMINDNLTVSFYENNEIIIETEIKRIKLNKFEKDINFCYINTIEENKIYNLIVIIEKIIISYLINITNIKISKSKFSLPEIPIKLNTFNNTFLTSKYIYSGFIGKEVIREEILQNDQYLISQNENVFNVYYNDKFFAYLLSYEIKDGLLLTFHDNKKEFIPTMFRVAEEVIVENMKSVFKKSKSSEEFDTESRSYSSSLDAENPSLLKIETSS